MNTYKIKVKSPDVIGLQWLKNVVEIANKGGVIDDSFLFRVQFPHEVTMILETEDKLETDITKGIVVYPVLIAKTKEEMEGMDWEDFKKECRAWGISGRHRETMTNQYLKATKQVDGVLEVQ